MSKMLHSWKKTDKGSVIILQSDNKAVKIYNL